MAGGMSGRAALKKICARTNAMRVVIWYDWTEFSPDYVPPADHEDLSLKHIRILQDVQCVG